jgi:hypothetical protein
LHNRVIHALCPLLLTALACNALSLPLWDLSTDSGVLLAYNTITEQHLAPDDFCIHHPNGLKEVVVVGGFAHDLGCKGDELFVGQTLGHFDHLTDEGLALNGWNNGTGREELALLWVEEVILAWRSPVPTENEDFTKVGIPFSPPTAQTLNDDRVLVELWVREPAGMLPEANYTFLRVVFEADGRLAEQEVIENFTVPFFAPDK